MSMIKEEIERLTQMLRVAMRMLDVSSGDVEKRLGLSHGDLSRMFAGETELTAEHVFQILEVLGLSPEELFHLVHARSPLPSSEPAVRLLTILNGGSYPADVEGPPAEKAMSREEIDALVSRVIQTMLREGEGEA